MNDMTRERSEESNWEISGSDKYAGKGSFSRNGIVRSLVLAYCPIYEVSKKKLNKTTDNKYGVLTNNRPTPHDAEILEAAFQTIGLLFRANAAI